jgi:hypothetical protein
MRERLKRQKTCVGRKSKIGGTQVTNTESRPEDFILVTKIQVLVASWARRSK